MKTRFNLAVIIAVIVACCSLAGCKKVMFEGLETESDYYVVSLGMAGEIIDVEESPLTRAGEGTDLYGIQVYSTPNKDLPEGTKVTWEKYAYGVFASDKDITIKLLKGKKYKFVATMVVDGQNRIQKSGGDTFYAPFSASGTNSGAVKVSTQFNYQNADYLNGLDRGNAYLGGSINAFYDHPNIERYYGELLDYIPGKGSNKALIKMKKVYFGAKFIAKGALANEGTLEVQMNEAPKMLADLSTNDKKVEDVFTFKDLKKSYENNDYTETLAVTLNWHRDDGTVFPLGTHEITFKRNKMHTVQVTIETENSDNQLGIEIEDADMTDDDDVTNIEDGEVVDTDVDTNA